MSRREWLIAGSLIVVLGVFLYALWMPVQMMRRSEPARPQCRNQLKVIALALHNYHDDYGSFPPGYLADADGRPLHSWRVLLLPYLDQAPLYGQYRFDEPWDGPNNRRLADQMPATYRCPQNERLGDKFSPLTSYCALAGSGTAFDGSTAAKVDDFRDGPSNTIIMVETPGPPVHWMQPDDISPEQWVRGLAAARDDDLPHEDGVYVMIADGAVRFLSKELPPEMVRGLSTIAGGEDVGDY